MEPAKKLTWTYADYRQFDPDERYELYNGTAIHMGPSPSDAHQTVSGNLHALLHLHLAGKQCSVFSAPYDVILPAAGEDMDSATTVVQPDLFILCDSSKRQSRGCVGAPDMVIEILSPSSAAADYRIKRRIYEEHGVQEYWIVDPVHKAVHILRMVEGKYQETVIAESDNEPITIAILPELTIDLKQVFSNMLLD